ncbi:MAG TPA: flagellar filament capping protein FliD [Acidobacteriota bacterium]|nr:flagellar filament capping protein FliD [Acidobacteriota bacterium]
MANAIDGIISNLNTTEIVEAMIASERYQVDHLTNRQTEATNQLTTYNAISALVVALQSSIAPLLQSSTFTASTLSVSDPTALSATASDAVAPGSYTLSVDALATNHQLASQGFADPTDALGIGTVQIAVGTGSTHTITLDSTNNTLTGLKNAINGAGIGVTASIIHDGTGANAYRLLLTSNETGTANAIRVTTSLSGGTAPDFANASFDTVEKSALATGTSVIALGASASYTGSANKTYSFTVAGSGTQTIGSGTITINWTDGTNSGSIEVADADTEVTLTGTGADGLTLTFGAGTLAAGDAFAVQTFAPLVQAATNAQVSLGSTIGGGSPVTITSASNTITDLINGITVELKAVTTSPVTITTALDKDGIKSAIQNMLGRYSDVMGAIDKQNSYNAETEQAGILLGDSFLLSLQSGLRAPLSGALQDLNLSLKTLRSVGISTADNGYMGLVDPSALFEQLDTDPAAVKALFTDSGISDNALITFLGAGTNAVESTAGYDVNITQAATRMVLRGAEISDPSVVPLTVTADANAFKLKVDGITSQTLTLTEKDYQSGAELAAAIQTRITADPNVGNRGVTVEWIDLGDTGYLSFTSGSYGSASTITVQAPTANSALGILGLGNGGTAIVGQDVAGTINGEAATGSGRILTGNADNRTTAGVSLEVKLEQADLVGGAEAKVTFTRGFAARLNRVATAIARSVDGSIARRTKGIQAQIDDLRDQIEDQEERLAVRRAKLYERFVELERVLGEFQSQQQFLTQQLSQLSANLTSMTSGARG